MLLASQVFGARAGKNGAEYARTGQRPAIQSKTLRAAEEKIKSLKRKFGTESPAQVKSSLQKLAYFNLLVTRSREKLSGLLVTTAKSAHARRSSASQTP